MPDIMLSALQHYAFCPRQCALIHLEQAWQENEHTVQGCLLHKTAHGGKSRMRDGIKTATGIELRSDRLGLHGKADVVEFHQHNGQWIPYPVEYKKGAPHTGCDADEVQLCAQALCLEEMLRINIAEGALFYGQTRRRRRVSFSPALRKRTEEVIHAVHALFACGKTPPPQKKPWCASCSLHELCLPELCTNQASCYVRKLCEDVP